jgi:hypothetical protein
MTRQLLFLTLCIFTYSLSNAQRNFWNNIGKESINVSADDIIEYDMEVKAATYYQLDKDGISAYLNSAPNRNTSSNSNVVLELPNQNGGIDIYEMFKVNTLSPQLAQNYSEIKSYVGRSTNPRDASLLRITITPQGFYAMVLKPNVGQFFINPYDKNAENYIGFLKSNATDITPMICEFTGNDSSLIGDVNEQNLSSVVDDGTLRQYDLALACTGEYAQFHINEAGLGTAPQSQQITAVLAAMVVSVDRVNQIYERDLGVTLQLIPNNDQLIFLDAATDPYTNQSGSTMLGENQTELDATIGSNNYDIGHVFSTGGGGIAGPGVICNPLQKARGVTGLPNPVGDAFDIDFVAHEMGHQHGANHTFNNFCGGARNNATAVEPGSGSTIMAYAGICAPNVQNNSDAYFHQISIDEIFSYISSGFGSTCGNFISQANSAPVITPVANYIIPNGTAFDVDATDADNDALTYNWEQMDNEISFPNTQQEQPPLQTSTQGPNFRSLMSSSDSRRYFPNFSSVLNNNLAPTWEAIPTVARAMDFSVTVRDNNVLVGQSATDFTTVNFANVGPFEVTSQNTTGINWLPGETRAITWNVAGTTANGINTSNVNILLSTDGGQNFDTVLASNTVNDGIENITVPSMQAPFCRIMVEPVDNIYYALNLEEFSIDMNVVNVCDTFSNSTSQAIPDGTGTPQNPDFQTPIFSSITIPNDITNISDINISINATHNEVNDMLFQLQNADPNNDSFVNLWLFNCSGQSTIDVTFNDNGTPLPTPGSTTCGNPITGLFAPADTNTSIADVFATGTQSEFLLAAADFISGDTGTLNSWEIEICSTTFSVADNSINGFTISPNPNQGIFNIRFNQPIAENSKISIYDFQGRLIENLDYSTGSIEQQIQLKNQYQSGVYLIEVSNENGKSVNKLIIK